MINDNYIKKNKTETFEKGEKVVMHSCVEAGIFNGKIWTCKTNSYRDRGGQDVVFLDGFSGCFFCEYLQKVNV